MHFQRRLPARLLAYFCVFGASLIAVSASAAPPLRTPWLCEQTYPVSQSHNTGSHLGKGSAAWDFALPVGTTIVAPAAGTVRKVRQDSTRYGCDPSFAYDANYVIIAFDDGTEALFLHLKANSSPLSVGDKVEVGDVIGKIGMSGYTCGPHLHFQVQKTCDSWWCDSVPATFIEYGDPSTGQQLTSANCVQPDESPLDESPVEDLMDGGSLIASGTNSESNIESAESNESAKGPAEIASSEPQSGARSNAPADDRPADDRPAAGADDSAHAIGGSLTAE
jgi:hypothetical protein